MAASHDRHCVLFSEAIAGLSFVAWLVRLVLVLKVNVCHELNSVRCLTHDRK